MAELFRYSSLFRSRNALGAHHQYGSQGEAIIDEYDKCANVTQWRP